ncbi:hypothetical protein KY327_00040 [Candidatus Woesearchaeota archaeon]|nr:hypothetical protein [Candidatus Woesearchaeota archaeon]
MDICVYYDERRKVIIDVSPRELDPEVKSRLEDVWRQPILRDILILLSEGVNRLPDIKYHIGHSPSTLHGAVQKLEGAGFLKTEMSYEGNKQKLLSSNVLCVTRNPRSKESLQRFFQGLWIDSAKTRKVIDAMSSDPDRWWTPEELSVKTKIPVDEISMLLSNFDSQMTRALSQFLKKPPFEKKVVYRARQE